MTASLVAWHDVECHGYVADLPLWLALAAAAGGPVLDVGAGTGRVALALAGAGHEVVALDHEPALLAALRARDPAGRVETVVADAAGFVFENRFALIVLPMQTLQLLGDRAAFWRCARRALRPGGTVAAAVVGALEAFEPEPDLLPAPDVGEFDGARYESQPVAVRVDGGAVRIERVRRRSTADGAATVERNAIELALVDPPALAEEAGAAGLIAVPGERIPATADHVGSWVVVLRG